MALQAVGGTSNPVFTDLDPSFTRNPKTSDAMLVQNDSAIRLSLKNLLSTAFGERLFQPTIGCSLRSMLFEPIDAITTLEIRDRVIQTIKNHEPRVGNVVVDVIANPDENSYTVNLEYSIVAIGRNDRISVVLERVR
jgi:phage baseplate assembly protein W